MIKVENTVKVYESVSQIDCERIFITSHWNQCDLVNIEIEDRNTGVRTKVTVQAKDLLAAISNATNTGRWG